MPTIITPEPIVSALDLNADWDAFLDREKHEKFHTRSLYDRIISSKIEFIERWGGFRWHSPVTEREMVATDVVGAIKNAVLNLWQPFQEKMSDLYWDYTYHEKTIYNTVICYPWLEMYEGSIAECYVTPKAHNNCQIRPFQNATSIAVRKGQSYARAILAHVRRSAKPYLDHERLGPEIREYIALWEKMFSIIGEIHKTRKVKVRVTFSVAPSDFAWLGDIEKAFGINSCYRSFQSQEKTKYNIGVTPGGFVVFLYFLRENDPTGEVSPYELIRADYPDARAWGFSLDSGIILSNLYRSTWWQAGYLFAQHLQDAFGAPAPIKYENYEKVTLEMPEDFGYANRDTRLWTFPDSTVGSVLDEFEDICEHTPRADEVLCEQCYTFRRYNDTVECTICKRMACVNCCRILCHNCSYPICPDCIDDDKAEQCQNQSHYYCPNCAAAGAMANPCLVCGESVHRCCAVVMSGLNKKLVVCYEHYDEYVDSLNKYRPILEHEPHVYPSDHLTDVLAKLQRRLSKRGASLTYPSMEHREMVCPCAGCVNWLLANIKAANERFPGIYEPENENE